MLFAAYRLPGGVAAVINSLSPLVVIVISVPLLSSQIRRVQIIAGLVGTAGVASAPVNIALALVVAIVVAALDEQY